MTPDSPRQPAPAYRRFMLPNDSMASNCERALQWWTDHPEAREYSEAWMVRFARSCRSPKVWASVVRVHEFFKDHAGFRGAPGFFADTPTAERIAWHLLGGDPGERWAADAVAAGPAEFGSISDVYDELEAAADQREASAMTDTMERGAFAARQSMRVEDWADPGAFASFEGRKPEWSGVLGLEGIPTSDNRLILPKALTWRELPITLQDQLKSQDGHDGAVPVGPITNIYRVDREDGGISVMGDGMFDSGQEGQDARRRMSEGTKQGVSMDLTEVELDLPEDPEAAMEVLMGGGQLRIMRARIGAATLVTIPAFEGARLQIIGDVAEGSDLPALVASGGRVEGSLRVVMALSDGDWIVSAPVEELAAVEPCSDFQPDEGDAKTCSQCGHRDYRHDAKAAAGDVEVLDEHMAEAMPVVPVQRGGIEYAEPETLIASGAPRPPAEWFLAGVYTGVRPVSIDEPDESGLRRIHGHVAAWGSCHIGFAGKCVDVPRGLDYASFQGDRVPQSVTCSDGSVVKAGPVVMDTVHPSLKASASDAGAHYAHTGCLAAQVRLYEDKHGLQMQGWVMPGLSDEHLARLSASDYSPDWRPRASANGGRGVVAVLAVPVSGFNLGLVASGAEQDGEPDELAIIGTTWTPHAAALASRKVDVLRRLDRPVSADLEALAASVEPPEVSARKAAVLARLRGESCHCGCGGTCG